jgi:hypothetical protein
VQTLHGRRSRTRAVAIAATAAIALFAGLLAAVPAQALSDTGTGGVFTPASGKVLDTRDGTGGYTTPFTANQWRSISIAGVAGLPNDGSVGSVTVDVTAISPSAQGQVFLSPDSTEADTLGLIYNATGSTTNTVTLAVGDDGKIQIGTTTNVGLVVELQGYYSANDGGTAPGGFVPVQGKNLVDTRAGTGAPKATIAPGGSVTVQVGGQAGIPANASGVVANFIAVNTTATAGYMTPYTAGTSQAPRGLNYAASVTTSVSAQVGLSSDGKMTIANAKGTINLVIDIQGYFTAAGTGGAVFTPAAGRLLDTRASGQTIVGQNETRVIATAGQAGIPVMGSGITAVAFTVTAVHTQSTNGRAIMWADGTTMPNTTAVYYAGVSIRSNTVIVPLGANGKIDLYNLGDPTNYVLDLQGWYVNPKVPAISCPSVAVGAWTSNPSGTAISCSVTGAPASDSGSSLITLVDDVPYGTTPLSTTAPTGMTIPVPGRAGWHRVTAIMLMESGDSTEQEIAFGLNSAAPSSTLAAIEAAAPESLMNLSSIAVNPAAQYAIQTQDDVAVSVPNDPRDGITLDPTGVDSGGTAISAQLPFAQSAGSAVGEVNGIVSYDNANGTSTVPIVHDDGSVQVATVIKSSSAPKRFTYPVALPANSNLTFGETGGITITDADGGFLGALDAPWAKDANGVDVATHYEANGNAITQVVDVTASTAYPVVADPDLWTTIKNTAGCALDIAAFALPAAKFAKVVVKAEKVIKASKAAIKAYKTLGGKLDKVIKSLKKYVKNKSSLSKAEVAAWATLIGAVGSALFNLLGLGNCLDLVMEFRK